MSYRILDVEHVGYEFLWELDSLAGVRCTRIGGTSARRQGDPEDEEYLTRATIKINDKAFREHTIIGQSKRLGFLFVNKKQTIAIYIDTNDVVHLYRKKKAEASIDRKVSLLNVKALWLRYKEVDGVAAFLSHRKDKVSVYTPTERNIVTLEISSS